MRSETIPRCLVVQHVAPERPYEIHTALVRAGVAVEICRVFSGEQLPASLQGFDGVVVMGGPMSAFEARGFPTRDQELALLSEAVDRDLPVLGVCLGAQLLALAAGGTVYRGEAGAEIGWGPVQLEDAAGDDPLFEGLPRALTVLSWHADTFDLPPRAVRLASSSAYVNQGFRLGSRGWGIQFHFEVDAAGVDAFLDAFSEEAQAAGVDPEVIAKDAPGGLAGLEQVRSMLCDRFAALVKDA